MIYASQPAGKFRIIGKHRADPHHDRIMLRAHEMRMGARGFARDPFALAGRERNLPVERARKFQCHEGALLLDAGQEARIEGACLRLQDAREDLDPALFQP